MTHRTSPIYMNRLFESEKQGTAWIERVRYKPEYRECTIKAEWRKIRWASDDGPEVYSVSFIKPAEGWRKD